MDRVFHVHSLTLHRQNAGPTGEWPSSSSLADSRKNDISVYMALAAAELDALIADLRNQYGQLSREYSETADEERKEDITDQMDAIDGVAEKISSRLKPR